MTTSTEDRLSSLKTIVEISALLVAGIWAYDRFLKVDEPSLRTNLSVSAELHRDAALSSPQCLMGVQTKVENIGKTAFRIDRVVQTVWRIPDSRLWTPTPPHLFVDVEALLKDTPAFPPLDTVAFASGQSLAYNYVPGAVAEFDFMWVVPEMPASETVVVRFDFDINNEPGVDFKFVWGKPCSTDTPTP
jgi:hypothetical protein